MGSLKPIKLCGNWIEGFSLDFHTVSSVYLGIDELGHRQFETTRTDIGELLYRLKYKNDLSTLNDIMKIVESFLSSWESISKVDVVLPIPPTDQNRNFQPVFEIAKRIGKYIEKPVYINVLVKSVSVQSKNLSVGDKEEIISSIAMKRNAMIPYNILIFDDLYETGATLNTAVKVLKKDPNIKDIYVLTLTKSRRE